MKQSRLNLALKDPRIRLFFLLSFFFVAEKYTLGEGNYLQGAIVAVIVSVIAHKFCLCPNCSHFMGTGYNGLWVRRFFKRSCPHCGFIYQKGVVEDNAPAN